MNKKRNAQEMAMAGFEIRKEEPRVKLHRELWEK